MLLLFTPIWQKVSGPVLALVFLQLPVYMLHQWEEHDGDRFRRFVNLHIGGGREALTPVATFWINALGVWAVDLIALYLAAYVSPSLGLIAVYMALVNGVAHVAQGLALRMYNPGLCTALVLFLPLGAWSAYVLTISGADWQAHAIGLGAALAVHAAIIAHVARRLAHMPSAVSPAA
jgi:hypothetical protein